MKYIIPALFFIISFSLPCFAQPGKKEILPTVLINPALIAKNDADFDNWGFENGLAGWTKEGTAFIFQPTYGDNVLSQRVMAGMEYGNNGIGGDYWKDIPYPIGTRGDYWIGTYESHVNKGMTIGNIQGDEPTGSLTSPVFILNHRFVSYLIGGGNDAATENVQLQMSKADFHAAVTAGASLSNMGTDGDWIIVHTGFTNRRTPSEIMKRIWCDMPDACRGKKFRIKINDRSAGGWGHINVDDFQFSDADLALSLIRYKNADGVFEYCDKEAPVWGFADTHAHPANYLAFGGNVISGELMGNPETALAKAGYPDMKELNFANGEAQQMYEQWIYRAYTGGLRLMSALAVNNWMFGSATIKQLVKGTSAPMDDKASADEQIRIIKEFAQRNNAWAEIAYSPADARRIIRSNKLAIVLGIEVDAIGNFLPIQHFDPAKIPLPIGIVQPLIQPFVPVLPPLPPVVLAGTDLDDRKIVNLPSDEAGIRQAVGAEIQRLNAQGVVQFTPYHYISGYFGGTAIFNRWFNEVNRKFTGYNYSVTDGSNLGIRYKLNNDHWGTVDATARELITGQSRAAAQDISWDQPVKGQINSRGLTRAGEILFEEFAKKGLVFDIEHAGTLTANALVDKARQMNHYPVISSHTDILELSFTGNGEFTHSLTGDNDNDNFGVFKTTLPDNLQHEGMTSAAKLSAISELGGTCGVLLMPYRKYDYRSNGREIVKNDCDGSSKTWCQQYLYSLDKMQRRGVALSSDRGMVAFIGPRFGINAAYNLGLERKAELYNDLRKQQVVAQENGVRYDVPIKAYFPERFHAAKNDGYKNAYEFTGDEGYYQDAWQAVAAYYAAENPWTRGNDDHIALSGNPIHTGRIRNLARGLFLNAGQFDKIFEGETRGAAVQEKAAGWCLRNNVNPNNMPRQIDHMDWLMENFQKLGEVWKTWQKMNGNNAPLRRYSLGKRDWDINIDGLAHYGLIPDFLQDCKNVGLTAYYMTPLFNSAEDYIRMWENCVIVSKTLR
jgi:hypothetical protein